MQMVIVGINPLRENSVRWVNTESQKIGTANNMDRMNWGLHPKFETMQEVPRKAYKGEMAGMLLWLFFFDSSQNDSPATVNMYDAAWGTQ